VSNPEVPSSAETSRSPWRDVFEVLSHDANNRLSDYGRKVAGKTIDHEFLYPYTGVVVSVTSPDINNYFEVIIIPSRNNSDEHDVRPAKGINME